MPVAASRARPLEPRLVGQQIGLAPIFTLLALYAGYKTIGVPGMISSDLRRPLPPALGSFGLQNS